MYASPPSHECEALVGRCASTNGISLELESKARKIKSTASPGAHHSPDQQNRTLILAIADLIGM
jgi:hypothetical protein